MKKLRVFEAFSGIETQKSTFKHRDKFEIMATSECFIDAILGYNVYQDILISKN